MTLTMASSVILNHIKGYSSIDIDDVDCVISGHSESYERTFINDTYGVDNVIITK